MKPEFESEILFLLKGIREELETKNELNGELVYATEKISDSLKDIVKELQEIDETLCDFDY